MDLAHALTEYDGKHTAILHEIYGTFQEHEDFVQQLMDLLKADVPRMVQSGASWLLKHSLEAGCTIDEAGVRQLLTQLDEATDWEVQLHLCQCLPFLTLPAGVEQQVEQFLRTCLEAENKFVRAWAYNGFHLLAKRFPGYQDEVNGMLAGALVNEAPSVRARIRNLR